MKKIIIYLFLIISIVTANSFKINQKVTNKTIKPLLYYTKESNFGTYEETQNYYYLELYSTKRIVYGRKLEESKENTMSDEDYEKLLDIIYSSEFKNLPHDISDNSIADGVSYYLTVYYPDGKEFKTGGSNPTDKTFAEVKQILSKYFY